MSLTKATSKVAFVVFKEIFHLKWKNNSPYTLLITSRLLEQSNTNLTSS